MSKKPAIIRSTFTPIYVYNFSRQSGTWTCEVLRKQRPGSSKLGSEATSAEFHIDVYRRKGHSQNLARLQVSPYLKKLYWNFDEIITFV